MGAISILAAEQALTEYNPASHAIFWLGLGLMGLLGVLALIEVWDWLWERIRRGRRDEDELGT